MSNEYNSFKDFNNASLKIKIDKKSYYGKLKIEDNHLILIVNMSNNIEHWRLVNHNYEKILGTIVSSNEPITLLNCIFSGNPYTINNNGRENVYEIEFIIDRILLGYKLLRLNNKKFKKFSIEYDNIDSFTNDQPYNFNIETLKYTATPSNYNIDIKGLSVNICFSCNINHSGDSLLIKRNTVVNFKAGNNYNISQVIEEVHKFRGFLIILLKRHIIVAKQKLYIDDQAYELFDCHFEKSYVENESILKGHRIKIEKILNLNEVYQEFSKKYKQLYPVLEIYYNTIFCFNPDLTKFILGTTTLEYFSNEFDFSNASLIARSKGSTKIDYVHKVEALIKNINDIINYSENDIPIVANNIKDARVYYIHYNKQRKKLSELEQQYYSYFIFDLLLLNIYKIINIDSGILENSCYKNIYYFKEDML